MSLAKCCLVTLSAGALALLVPSCGFPPCFKGAIRIEAMDLDASACLWEMWPAGTTIEAKTLADRGYMSLDCDLQQLEYLSLPKDARLRGESSNRAPQKGIEIAYFDGIFYEEDDCILSVSVELAVNNRYDDFESALAGQERGDVSAFYLQVSYLGEGQCVNHPFEPSEARECGNTYRARVTKL